MPDDAHRYSGPNRPGAARSSPYPTQRLAPPVSLVDTARAIERASNQIAHQTHAQLALINEQIQFLQTQARTILEKAQRDLALHQAECRFKRVVGQCYHLYRRANGTTYFSMLSPDDYRGDPPHDFLGSYWLEPDETWTLDGTPRRAFGGMSESAGTWRLGAALAAEAAPPGDTTAPVEPVADPEPEH